MQNQPSPRWALITGTSTGIGRATVLKLAAEGFYVLAGVRRSVDGDNLLAELAQKTGRADEAKAQIVPLILDVADSASVQAAIEQVRAQTGAAGLWALINNAGIVVGGPVETLGLAEWRRQFDTNLFGWIELTQGAFPLLRQGILVHGANVPRIVLISSIGGRVAQPFLAPYTCSKWATTALGDSLRLELRRHGIGVTVIEPGAIATPIWDKGKITLAEIRAEHSARQFYGPELEGLTQAVNTTAAGAIPAEVAADAIFRALTAEAAPARVIIGRDAKVAAFLKRVLPGSWFDALLLRRFRIADASTPKSTVSVT
jgi:NAD(P)-dependent dehydrogenase (short-subunit alcohol dehydrogenase family)